MLRVLAVLAAFGLLVYAFTDFASSDEEDRGDIPRWLWLVIIVLLPYFGPISWIAFSRSRRKQAGRGQRPVASGKGPAPRGRTRRRASGPVAPDDDPDFLWRLAQEQRRQARSAQGNGDTAAGDTPTDGTSSGTSSGTSAGKADGRPTGTSPDDRADGASDERRSDDETHDDGTPA
ncbi:PLDc N-terminal domain-containing protein [Sanguibacter sp. 25GB23B1]|uniref:PLD nuclease N-terminal domain-containing protein n=1 Tax=unclassified Sanguibacter TaxID=2645534 RepID=UPI0032AF11B0